MCIGVLSDTWRSWSNISIISVFVLALPIILFWVLRGSGNFQKGRLIGLSQLAVLAISIVLFFTGIEPLQSICFGAAFIILLSMLLTPVIFKNRV